MSYVEHRIGKMVKIKDLNRELTMEEDETLSDIFDGEIAVIQNSIYMIIENKEIMPSDDLVRGKINKDGEIEFEVKWYNGGTGFKEMLEKVVEKIEEEK